LEGKGRPGNLNGFSPVKRRKLLEKEQNTNDHPRATKPKKRPGKAQYKGYTKGN